jgi:hypothetical protein
MKDGYIRGLVGTAILWSGPTAMVVLVGVLLRAPLTTRFFNPLAAIAASGFVTAPLGAWLRKETRWTSEQRFARRMSRSIEKVAWQDFGFLFGTVAMVFLPLLILFDALLRVRSVRFFVLDYVFGANRSNVDIQSARIHVGVRVVWLVLALLLAAGFWRRTVWARRRYLRSKRSQREFVAPISRERERQILLVYFVTSVVAAVAVAIAAVVQFVLVRHTSF